MRKINYVLGVVLIILFYSCSIKDQVTKIEYNYANKKVTFNESVKLKDNEVKIKEGTTIDVIVTGYNPLVNDFTLEKDPSVLFYMNANQASTLTQFLKIDESKETLINPIIVEVIEQQYKDENCKLIDTINSKTSKLNKSVENFKLFYNAIVKLDNTYTRLKYSKELSKECFCNEINTEILNIKRYFFDNKIFLNTNSSEEKCKEMLSICSDPVIGDLIFEQRDKYYNYFKETTDTLNKLSVDLEKEKIVKKKNICKTEVSPSLPETIKKVSALKEDFLTKFSPKIDLIINNYKALAFLEFEKNFIKFKVEASDEFVLKLTTKNTLVNATTIETIVSLPVCKSLKIDYSAGMFFSGLYDETYNKRIEIITNTDNTTTNKYRIDKLDGGAVCYGAMGYINFHTQYNQDVNFGASLGAGLMFNQSSKLVVSPSLSLLFGKSQRAIIHLGASFAQVDRIYSLYGHEQFTDVNYIPETKTIVKGSFSVGISYNLTK